MSRINFGFYCNSSKCLNSETQYRIPNEICVFFHVETEIVSFRFRCPKCGKKYNIEVNYSPNDTKWGY